MLGLRTGCLLRRIGLLIEAIALFGWMAAAHSRENARWDHEPSRFDVTNWLGLGLVIGFCLWAFGTGLIYRAKVLSKKRIRPLEL